MGYSTTSRYSTIQINTNFSKNSDETLNEDVPFLESLGVTAVFGPGSGLAEITETVQGTLARD